MPEKYSPDDCFDLENFIAALANELSVRPAQVRAAIGLLDAGNTLPFIARYRKEATQSLDELALRSVEDGLRHAKELAARKATILNTLLDHPNVPASLPDQILNCDDKQRLEDLYLPYKPKRRTRATMARERGLQPLADILLAQAPLEEPKSKILQKFICEDVPDGNAALQGAGDIVAEFWSELPEVRAWLTEQCWEFGRVHSVVKRGQREAGEKFAAYFDHQEPTKRIPSHRFLAMKRGESEGVLRIQLDLNDEYVLRKLKARLAPQRNFPFHSELLAVVEDCYQRLLLPSVESVVLQSLRESAEQQAIDVFAKNLRDLLLAAPAGPRCTMGIDPGYRTGCKIAVVDPTGKFLESATIYATPPKNDRAGAEACLSRLIQKHQVELIAIGNGTASRETEQFVTAFLSSNDLQIEKVIVNESGASIYSASELAAAEYPDLDVTVRGAISIAHRLQDPLAELVKIDPKSIGVGQYQHDVNQTQLRMALEREVQSCVNSVGVDLNMASASLLAHVAGIGPKLASNIVEHRDHHGSFGARQDLLNVPKLGKRAFQQAAGFLRIREGSVPLDASAVHPEQYSLVGMMADSLNVSPQRLVGNASLVAQLTAEDFVQDDVGLPTILDIIDELAKPGRDPRKKFRAARLNDGVHELKDVKAGMQLEGTVTNVTHFGAFVDLGVHQDGLIHVSQIANEFVSDPAEILSVGDVVRVKVLEVDASRKRISLSRKELL